MDPLDPLDWTIVPSSKGSSKRRGQKGSNGFSFPGRKRKAKADLDVCLSRFLFGLNLVGEPKSAKLCLSVELPARFNALQLPRPERSFSKSIATFTPSEWPAITSRDFESVLGSTGDAGLLCLLKAFQHLDPEPSFSESIAAFTPSEMTAITSRDLKSVLCSTNEAEFQAEKARLLGLDTLIQNASKPWIFEDSAKETIIFGKQLLDLMSRPPLNTRNELHLQRSNYVQLFQPLLHYFKAISSSWAVAQGISHEALSDGLSAEEYLPHRIDATDERFRLESLDEVGAVIPIDWVLNPIDIRVNVLVFGRPHYHTMMAVHQRLSTEKFTQPLSSNATIHVIIHPSHDEIFLTHDRMGTGEDDTGSSNLFMLPISLGCQETQPSEETAYYSGIRGFRISSEITCQSNSTASAVHVSSNHDAAARTTEMEDSTRRTAVGGMQPISSFEFRIQEGSITEPRQPEPSEVPASSRLFIPSRLASKETWRYPYVTQDADCSLNNLLVVPFPALDDQSQEIETPSDTYPARIGAKTAEFSTQEDTESEGEDEGDEDIESYITGSGSVSNWAYTPSEGDTCEGPDDLSLILERIRGELLDAFMDQFWMIANQNMIGNFRVHAGSSSASSTSNKSDFYTPRASSSNMSSGKRTGEGEREDFPEEDGDGRPKRPKVPSTSTTSFEELAQFACPYRKHDPRKFNFRDWPTCALTPQRTVARVKGHLYRHHRVHQCQRCKELFESQEQLDNHIIALQGCEVRPPDPFQPIYGITVRLKEQLQSRKKAYPGQTEAKRWQQMYQLIFPNEIAPSPYFEPIRDQHDDKPHAGASEELARYEEYLRNELPQCFRRALEAAVDNEIRCVGDHLRSQILTLLDTAQKEAFDNYHAVHNLAAEIVPLTSPPENDYDNIGEDKCRDDSATGCQFNGNSTSGHQDESCTFPQSPQPATVHRLDQINDTCPAESPLDESEILGNGTVISTANPILDTLLGFEAPNQDTLLLQLELDEMHYSYEQWLDSHDKMDLDLLQDPNWQIGANAKIRI